MISHPALCVRCYRIWSSSAIPGSVTALLDGDAGGGDEVARHPMVRRLLLDHLAQVHRQRTPRNEVVPYSLSRSMMTVGGKRGRLGEKLRHVPPNRLRGGEAQRRRPAARRTSRPPVTPSEKESPRFVPQSGPDLLCVPTVTPSCTDPILTRSLSANSIRHPDPSYVAIPAGDSTSCPPMSSTYIPTTDMPIPRNVSSRVTRS